MAKNSRENHAADRVVQAARVLRDETSRLKFRPPVTHVYRPLDYAWAAHENYLRRYASDRKRVVFLGMNPGPFGMVQTGVPFGEIAAVRDWLGITAAIQAPRMVHPKRPIHGFDCVRSEISGQRLWNLFAQRFGTAAEFSKGHFVMNYCPLAFLETSGFNRTPDKLPREEREPLFAACDKHIREVLAALQPTWIIGVGEFAVKRAREIFPHSGIQIGRIPHPSPASPAANRNWAASATEALRQLGVWD